MCDSKGKKSCASARREGEWGEQNYDAIYFSSRHWVEVTGQIHASAVLPPGKYLINKSAHEYRTAKNAAFCTESYLWDHP
jgi:hypothetical protein